jgi:4-hydroxybenzoate polyprenyltransferase
VTAPPWLLLLLVVALVLAIAYQIAVRRFGWRVVLYWSVLFMALLIGEAAAESFGWNISRLGDLRVIPDVVAAAIALAGLWFLGV